MLCKVIYLVARYSVLVEAEHFNPRPPFIHLRTNKIVMWRGGYPNVSKIPWVKRRRVTKSTGYFYHFYTSSNPLVHVDMYHHVRQRMEWGKETQNTGVLWRTVSFSLKIGLIKNISLYEERVGTDCEKRKRTMKCDKGGGEGVGGGWSLCRQRCCHFTKAVGQEKPPHNTRSTSFLIAVKILRQPQGIFG